MTRGTISIKRKNGTYDQLWYVNSDGYPSVLGNEIFTFLKNGDDFERAAAIFKKAKCYSTLETAFTIGETNSIQPILAQCNDYSYVLDEETGKWGFYNYREEKLYDLEEELKNLSEEDD